MILVPFLKVGMVILQELTLFDQVKIVVFHTNDLVC